MSEPAAEPSPLAPAVEATALVLLLAALVVRALSTGAGFELQLPGAQLLCDALACCAAACALAARGLGRERPFTCAGWAPWAWLAWVAWLALGAARASHPDLAWRTVATWACLPLLGLTARELASRSRPRGALLLGATLACAAWGAALGGYEGLVEIPARIAAYQAGDPQLLAELAAQDPSYRQAFIERLHSRGASGTFLLPGLLATACLLALPLLGLAAGAGLRRRGPRPGPIAAALAVGACCLGLVAARSKGAAVSLGVVLGLAALLVPPLARWRRPLAGAALLGGAALGAVGVRALALGPERAGVGLSLTVRLEYWEAALAMWRQAPWSGLGPNQFREYYGAFKSARAEEALHAHNALLQLLAETGLIGLALLALLLACALAPAWRAATGPRDPSEPTEPPPLPRGLLGLGAAGLLLGWLLLGAHGDVVGAGEPLPWLATLLALLALTPALATALLDLDPRWLAALGLAGVGAWFGDALLDFGFHQAGVSTLAWLLIGLAPSAVPSAQRPTRAPWLVAAPILLGGVGLVLGPLPRALEADAAREAGRAAHFRAAQESRSGRETEARAALEAAGEAFALATASYPAHAATWHEAAAVEDALAEYLPAERALHVEAALAANAAALQAAPRGASLYLQRGRLLRERGGAPAWAEAQAAFDRAVELYPTQPEHLLEAGGIRALRWQAGEHDPELRRSGLELLQRAEDVSATTRLVRIRLRPAQLEQLQRWRAAWAERP